jgi:hypothetical protein
MPNLIQALVDHFRCPEHFLPLRLIEPMSDDVGYFRFGADVICFGQSSRGFRSPKVDAGLYDALNDIAVGQDSIDISFNPTEVIDNLRLERYTRNSYVKPKPILDNPWTRSAYYAVRELLPTSIRRQFQRLYLSDWRTLPFPNWPVDLTVDSLQEELLRISMQACGVKRIPFVWFWPEGAPSCLIITHDVETSAGKDFTSTLIDIDDSYGFKSSFQVVPEKRYDISDSYVQGIRARGCEFNLHDLNHDGKLYQEHDAFCLRAEKINQYARKYNARGFRAGAMYRMPDWYDSYEFSYDMSVPNVAHLEPKRGGCCTVFPFFIGKILELPLTTCEDYSVFHILSDYSIDVWKKQIELIRNRNGLMSFLAHPDYLIDPKARKVYECLLDHLREMITREGNWAALPGELDQWWRARSQMKLVQKDAQWTIVGPDKERARIAFATLNGDSLTYEIAAAGDQVHSQL